MAPSRSRSFAMKASWPTRWSTTWRASAGAMATTRSSARAQFVDWFNLDHLGRSAAQFDEAKLRWVNAQHMKAHERRSTGAAVRPQPATKTAASTPTSGWRRSASLFKDRCDTLVALADWAAPFYRDPAIAAELRAQHVTEAIRPAIDALARRGCARSNGHRLRSLRPSRKRWPKPSSKCRNSRYRCVCLRWARRKRLRLMPCWLCCRATSRCNGCRTASCPSYNSRLDAVQRVE